MKMLGDIIEEEDMKELAEKRKVHLVNFRGKPDSLAVFNGKTYLRRDNGSYILVDPSKLNWKEPINEGIKPDY